MLVVNKIDRLPAISADSILNVCDSNIVIGYVNVNDIADIPQNSRITYINLKAEFEDLEIEDLPNKYVSFDSDSFFKLVRLKWVLFEKVFENFEFDFLVYSDLDVIWLKNPIEEFAKSFTAYPDTLALVQDFTTKPSSPNLCMGIFVLKNHSSSLRLVEDCKILHLEMAKKSPRIGDDDVITSYYKRLNGITIRLLPQISFPVGNLLKAFTKRDVFPGLKPESPYIFHANFVVGNLKKIMVLDLFMNSFKKRPLGINHFMHIYFKILIFLKFRSNGIKFYLKRVIRYKNG
jgi:hypothetical protein